MNKRKAKEGIRDGFVCVLLTMVLFAMCFHACRAEEELAAGVSDVEQVQETEMPVVTTEPTTQPVTASSEDVEPDTIEEVEVPTEQIVTLYNIPLDADLQLFIIQLCEEHHIDSAVVMSVIQTESMFQASVMGDSGKSFGLMQIQQRFHKARMDKLGCTDLLDPYQNVMVGIDYLAELLESYRGNMEMALVAYNAGIVGAKEHWFSKGIYSSEYSRKVLGNIENLTEGMMQVAYTDNPIADFEA